MTTANTVKVIKTFTLPKLNSNGSNWILFQDSIELKCSSHSLKDHIDGTGAEPTHPHAGQTTLSTAEQTAVDKYMKKFEKWTTGEAMI